MGDSMTDASNAAAFEAEGGALPPPHMLETLLWQPIAMAAVSRSHPVFGERVLEASAVSSPIVTATAELVSTLGVVDAFVGSGDVDAALHEAAERMPQLTLLEADLNELDDRGGTGYDLVQSIGCTIDISAYVKRVRPDGRVAVAVWAPSAFALLRAGANEANAARDAMHFDSVGALARALNDAGLIEVQSATVPRHLDLGLDDVVALAGSAELAPLIGDEYRILDESVLRERAAAAVAEYGSNVDATMFIAVGRARSAEPDGA